MPPDVCSAADDDSQGQFAWVGHCRQDRLRAAERAGRGHEWLALQEAAKALPWGAGWDELCRRDDVPVGADWLADVATYERDVLAQRT